MAKTVSVSGNLSKEDLAATLTRKEQLGLLELKTLVQSPSSDGTNQAGFENQPNQLGELAVVDAGATSSGSKLFSTKAFILKKLSNIDIYRLPL
jgi:hypothetical protein